MFYNSNSEISSSIKSVIEIAENEMWAASDSYYENYNPSEMDLMKTNNEVVEMLKKTQNEFSNKDYVRSLVFDFSSYIPSFIEDNKDNASAMLFFDKVYTEWRYSSLKNML